MRRFSPVFVTINHGKPLQSYCVNCGKSGTVHFDKSGTLPKNKNIIKRCTRCISVAYCSRECQKQDYKIHKKSCKFIETVQGLLRKEARALVDATGPDIFSSRYLGNFDDIQETRPYRLYRLKMVDVCVKEGKLRLDYPGGRLNELAIHHGLEHIADLLDADHCDRVEMRKFAPGALIAVGKHGEAFSFLKYWFIKRGCEHEEENRAFLSNDEDGFAEPFEGLSLNNDVAAHLCLDMALLKLCIFSEIRAAQILSQSFAVEDHIIATVIDMTNVPENWRKIDTAALLYQARQLLTCVHDKNERILPGLLNPDSFRDVTSVAAHPGTPEWDIEDAACVVQQSFHYWKLNPVALNFVSNCIKDIEGSRLPIVQSKK